MLKRIFKNGWHNFIRQGSLSSGATFAILLGVLVAVGLFLFHGLMNYAIEEVESKIDISLFFNEEVSREEILEFKAELGKLEEVKAITFVSKEKAYDSFVEKHEDLIYIEALRIIEVNPFLASLRIVAKDPKDYKAISTFIDLNEDTEDLIYKKDDFFKEEVIQKIESISANVRVVGIGLIVLFSFLAFLTILNTIKLTIFSQRKEIEVMKLVGATNSFIKWPYIIQSTVCAVIASGISFLVTLLALYLANASLSKTLMGFNAYEYFLDNLSIILIGQTIIAMLLAFVSSSIAISKYLNK